MNIVNEINEAISGTVGSLGSNGKLYVGFSGGVDSTVLLHSIVQCCPEKIIALHVNHGLEDSASKWEDHCGQFCHLFNIEYRSIRAVVSSTGNLEAAARKARYDYFQQQVGSNDLLVLGHHQDDQLETIWMRINSGRGAYGMPESRRFGTKDNAYLCRPLLSFSRLQLLKYASYFGLDWVEDPSNKLLDRQRNYLRHEFLPKLTHIYPDMGYAALRLNEYSKRLDISVINALEASPSRLPIDDLPNNNGIIAEVIRAWLSTFSRRIPRRVAIEEFAGQLASPRDKQPSLNLEDGAVRRFKNCLYYARRQKVVPSSCTITSPGVITLSGRRLLIKGIKKAGSSGNGALILDFVGNHPGIKLFYKGSHRRIKDLLQQANIPPWERFNYPIILNTDGLALCLPGIASRDLGCVGAGQNFCSANWKVVEDPV